ncbi:DUF2163 domain-containing protein [Bosea sp. 117]|uniref:DUF2163 domain-containing protein n=1 Tax=Bosea sp. 117 TaxID=1125973 RepID=UPI0004944D13|nr:DUF2163 domain-containing protein [Bosea sp. 117]
MRTLPPLFALGLASGVTTLARCWRITRRDGAVIGLTEHDEDLTVDGTAFRAAGGVAGAESSLGLGFAVKGSELSAALASDVLDEAELAAGLFDGADVELLLADWSAPTLFVLLRRFSIGEVRREAGAFAAELRGLAETLNETRGRVYAAPCDADLGDARCKVNLALPVFTGAGTVTAVEGDSLFTAAGLDVYGADWFARGRLVFTGGANTGFATEVKTHRKEGGIVRLDLWQRPPEPLVAGDAFTVSAGCDKRFATCRDNFGNTLNFRGFPHIPGNDRVLHVAMPGDA